MLRIKVRKYNFRDPVFPKPLELTELTPIMAWMQPMMHHSHDCFPPEWRALIHEYDWEARELHSQGFGPVKAAELLASRRKKAQDKMLGTQDDN